MPPKKAEEPKVRKPIVGRMGTNLKMGIVGLPNVGKSTFFNILTKLQAAAENFPFCTIDPNEGRVPVPDPRFDYLCDKYKPASKVPAFLNVVDIAGLVKGASEGILSIMTLTLCQLYNITRSGFGKRFSESYKSL